MWRFDQGRLSYFQFDEIKKIAIAIANLDKVIKPANSSPDVIREILSLYSTLPFAPDNYYVWRNYGRVFGCLLLASEINGRIYATDLCKTIANDPDNIDCDDYLAHFAKKFYYPSPVFQGYRPKVRRTYPVIAIIKYLIAEFKTKGKDHISVDEIMKFLLANHVTGLEPLAFFCSLKPNVLNINDDAKRQLRELIRFISQFSFLKWDNPNLYLEVKHNHELIVLERYLIPCVSIQNNDADVEILNMGSGFVTNAIGAMTRHPFEALDEEFTEGQKSRVTHIRTERSPKLKRLYFSQVLEPQVCRMCRADTAIRYPWAEHVIELHHLLPLASPIRVETGRSSLKDLVGLCPSCHSATHRFYSKWFKENGIKDFNSYDQAIHVYNDAKNRIVLP